MLYLMWLGGVGGGDNPAYKVSLGLAPLSNCVLKYHKLVWRMEKTSLFHAIFFPTFSPLYLLDQTNIRGVQSYNKQYDSSTSLKPLKRNLLWKILFVSSTFRAT